eukprot:GHVN01023364.1.p1 GENE.GHVN01023364.1~~GHVN01023364.1.p1  ORF type:complete len:989 (-),score=75.24 GHVN01023364.1:133-3099(-)
MHGRVKRTGSPGPTPKERRAQREKVLQGRARLSALFLRRHQLRPILSSLHSTVSAFEAHTKGPLSHVQGTCCVVLQNSRVELPSYETVIELKHATSKGLLVNLEFQSLWNFRRELICLSLTLALNHFCRHGTKVSRDTPAADAPQAELLPSAENAGSSRVVALVPPPPPLDESHHMFCKETVEVLREELDFVTIFMQNNPKSYSLWAHRLWVVFERIRGELGINNTEWFAKGGDQCYRVPRHRNEYLSSAVQRGDVLPHGDDCIDDKRWGNALHAVNEELKFCDSIFDLDSRNFHCWNHRQAVRKYWVALRLIMTINERRKTCLAVERDPVSEEKSVCSLCWADAAMDVLKEELVADLRMTKKLLNRNFSNYSAWHLRTRLLPQLIRLKTVEALRRHNQAPVPPGRDQCPTSTYRPFHSEHHEELKMTPIEVITQEAKYIMDGLYTEPGDQSVWQIHDWLVLDLLPKCTKALLNEFHGGVVNIPFEGPSEQILDREINTVPPKHVESSLTQPCCGFGVDGTQLLNVSVSVYDIAAPIRVMGGYGGENLADKEDRLSMGWRPLAVWVSSQDATTCYTLAFPSFVNVKSASLRRWYEIKKTANESVIRDNELGLGAWLNLDVHPLAQGMATATCGVYTRHTSAAESLRSPLWRFKLPPDDGIRHPYETRRFEVQIKLDRRQSGRSGKAMTDLINVIAESTHTVSGGSTVTAPVVPCTILNEGNASYIEAQMREMEILNTEIKDVEELLEMEPNCKHGLLSICRLRERINCLLGALGNETTETKESNDYFHRLIKIDSQRKMYYEEQIQRMALRGKARLHLAKMDKGITMMINSKWDTTPEATHLVLSLANLGLQRTHFGDVIRLYGLRKLSLKGNLLSDRGVVPLGCLTTLTHLDLSENRLTVLPTKTIMLDLTNLEILNLSANPITRVENESETEEFCGANLSEIVLTSTPVAASQLPTLTMCAYSGGERTIRQFQHFKLATNCGLRRV